jgi:hypothetical protein
MKTALLLVLCAFLCVFASARVGSEGYNEGASHRGTYTVVENYPVGLSGAYGLAIMTENPNSIWISQYGPTNQNNEYDMTTGTATGITWPISGGVDCDDMGYCEYTGSANQFFFGDWYSNGIQVYDVSTTGASPYMNKDIAGPSAWSHICGVDAGHDNLYAACFFTDQIAWGSYTGTEATVSWSTASFSTVSGLAVWGDYLFACTQNVGVDNIFIFELNPDGSPNMAPVWSCTFTESVDGPNGGLDYDGTYLWVYPQNDNLFKLDIDWTPSPLARNTWGSIKSQF